MSAKPRYIQAYAIIRVDDSPYDFWHDAECIVGNAAQPSPGPSNVKVKEVVATAEEAQREVVRLNALNAEKGCKYFWQSTHVFLNGGSHGSANQR